MSSTDLTHKASHSGASGACCEGSVRTDLGRMQHSAVEKYANLICPVCHGDSWGIRDGTASFDRFLICGGCHKEYPVYDGIPIFANRGVINGVDYSSANWPLLEREKELSLEKEFSLSDQYLRELPFPTVTKDTTFQLKSGAMGHNFLEIVEKLKLKGSERVLDVGAGSCWTSYRLAQQKCEVVATDQRTMKYWGLRSVNTYAADVEHRLRGVCCNFDVLPFKDQCFDVVVINNAFQYVSSLSHFLQEVRRVLKDGGTLVLAWTGTRGILKSPKWGPGHNIVTNMRAIRQWQFAIVEIGVPARLFESVMNENSGRWWASGIATLVLPAWRKAAVVRRCFNSFLHMPLSCLIGLPFNLIAIKKTIV